jgi:HlyD family secretion protein
MSNLLRSSRLFVLLGVMLLIVTVVGTHYLLPTSGPAAPRSTSSETDGVIHCFGHVDVEGGVIALVASQPGRVVQIDQREGAAVENGAPLLRLDSRLAEQRSREAEATWHAAEVQLKLAKKTPQEHGFKVAQQRAAVQAAEQALIAAEHEGKRQEKLFASKQVSREAMDIAHANANRLRAVLDAEKVRLEELEGQASEAKLAEERASAEAAAAQARLEQARILVDEHVVKAPCKGKVLRVLVSVGDTLGTSPGAQPAIMFCPDSDQIIRAEVSQEFALKVRPGDHAIISDDTELNQQQCEATVVRVSPWFARRRSMLLEPGQLNDVRTLECILKLKPGQKEDAELKLGQRVHVRIEPRRS